MASVLRAMREYNFPCAQILPRNSLESHNHFVHFWSFGRIVLYYVSNERAHKLEVSLRQPIDKIGLSDDEVNLHQRNPS